MCWQCCLCSPLCWQNCQGMLLYFILLFCAPCLSLLSYQTLLCSCVPCCLVLSTFTLLVLVVNREATLARAGRTSSPTKSLCSHEHHMPYNYTRDGWMIAAEWCALRPCLPYYRENRNPRFFHNTRIGSSSKHAAKTWLSWTIIPPLIHVSFLIT